MISKRLVSRIKHVWSKDPALDRSDPAHFDKAWAEFLKKGDLEILPLKGGEHPTIFEIAPLTRRQFERIGSMSGLEADTEAVACSLRSVSGFEVDGSNAVLEHEGPQSNRRLTAASLDAIYDVYLFAELGRRILEISSLDPLAG